MLTRCYKLGPNVKISALLQIAFADILAAVIGTMILSPVCLSVYPFVSL